jgi:hypothetical protein
MATGDVVWFDEALAYMQNNDWSSTDVIWVGLTSSTPAAADAAPSFGSGGTTNYTEVTPGGNYSAGGLTQGTWGAFITEAAGVAKYDTGEADPTWAQNASNPTNARYAVLYNTTDAANPAIAYVDLGAIIDMTIGSLTISWNGSGIATLSKV